MAGFFEDNVTGPISRTLAAATNPFVETRYPFDSVYFPEDLGSEYMSHYVTIKFFTGGATGTGSIPGAPTPQQNVFNVGIYMPSDTGGGVMPIYNDSHEYADIKLTNIINNAIGVNGQNALGVGRRAINPGVQVIYRSTSLRVFQFGFLMAPRNEKESQAIEKIIKNVRKFGAPENKGLLFMSPAEVEIKFYSNGKENPHLPKLNRCVIQAIEANPAPQGMWSTFTNGYPVSWLLSFTVQEMVIIDRTLIEQGY
jgi:hypothetical protein